MKSLNHLRGRIEYRLTTADDFYNFYGDIKIKETVRAISFFIDGELKGISGVKLSNRYYYAFSDFIKDDTIEKQTIWRCALIVRDFLKSLKSDVYAVASDDFEGASRFLKRLGFRSVGAYYVLEA